MNNDDDDDDDDDEENDDKVDDQNYNDVNGEGRMMTKTTVWLKNQRLRVEGLKKILSKDDAWFVRSELRTVQMDGWTNDGC